ncbi:MAG: hypothetical protein WD077_00435 [Bacteroidia bacterium]
METSERVKLMLEGIEREKQEYRRDMGKYPDKVFLHPYSIEKIEEVTKHFETRYEIGKLNDMKIVLDESREPYEYAVE